jgi:hypothetical protein
MQTSSPLVIVNPPPEVILANLLNSVQIIELKNYFEKKGNKNCEITEQMLLDVFTSVLGNECPPRESLCLIFRQLDADCKGLGFKNYYF